ncbi:MAG: MFS transporter [Spirochaetales bacterium]|nr:MFS transporter [Candidatus Physcosoma equi]
MKKKTWLSIIVIGLAGQIAWTIENMYFNVFLYNTISTDPKYIAAMVAASAVVATLTTILAGTVSDRTGVRKPFISWGYVIWAFTVALFAFVSPSSLGGVTRAALTVIILDCVMTFFGSTANDAVYNAYITETVDNGSRTKVESVVQILPMAAMLIVFGLLDGFTQKGNWKVFFLVVSSIMLLSGILSFFFIENDRKEKKGDTSFLYALTYGFTPKAIRGNKNLYIALLAFGLNALGMQVFYPYLIIYIQNYLGFDNYVVLLGTVLVASSIICVLLGKVIDRMGRIRCTFPAILLMTLGMVMIYFSSSFVMSRISGVVMMTGYLLSTSVLSSLVREYTPEGKEGGTQGVRMIFQVMLPMVIGPYLGAAAIRNSNITYEELGQVKQVPTPLIFLIAAGITLISLIPLLWIQKKEK